MPTRVLVIRATLPIVVIAVIVQDGAPDWRRPLDASSNYLPRWSPDGRRLAYYRRLPEGWRIHLVGVEGGEPRPIDAVRGNDYQPAWSPDGAHLVFDSDRDGNRELYVRQLSSGATRRLTDDPARDVMPAWSPDGREIAFVSDREDGAQVWAVPASGGVARRVTRERWTSLLRPVSSPDGTRLAVTVGRDDGRRRVVVVGRDDGTVREITPWGDGSNPSWSPDGRQLVFDASPAGDDDSSGGAWELWVVNADGTGHRRLTNDGVNDWGPAWSPNGREIAFSRGLNDQYEIFRIGSDGTSLRRVTRQVFP